MKDLIERLEPINLFHLARNENTIPEYRLTAVEALLEMGSKYADEPELVYLVAQVKEKQEQQLSLPVEDCPLNEQIEEEDETPAQGE